jgi:hypothetical protein
MNDLYWASREEFWGDIPEMRTINELCKHAKAAKFPKHELIAAYVLDKFVKLLGAELENAIRKQDAQVLPDFSDHIPG